MEEFLSSTFWLTDSMCYLDHKLRILFFNSYKQMDRLDRLMINLSVFAVSWELSLGLDFSSCGPQQGMLGIFHRVL